MLVTLPTSVPLSKTHNTFNPVLQTKALLTKKHYSFKLAHYLAYYCSLLYILVKADFVLRAGGLTEELLPLPKRQLLRSRSFQFVLCMSVVKKQ